jgi:uncharacterized protein YdbL (DUF1318 family)
MKKISKLVTVAFFVSASFIAFSSFGGAKEIKARMAKRLPVINQLKAKGIVGENNQGYLQFVGSKKEKADVVNAENADRKKVYEAIAKQQKTTAALVGKRRAAQIAQIAGKGEWIQSADGKWKKK